MPLLLCIVAGGIFLLFSGLEINLRKFGGERSLTGKLWVGAFVPPFLVGLALPFVFSTLFPSPAGLGAVDTALILGIALSVSAVPVVIKIMDEMGWTGTLRAQRVVFTAVLCDIAAWLLFFFVLPSAGWTPWLFSHWPLLMFFVGLVLAYLWPSLPSRMVALAKLNKWVVGPVFFIGVGQALDFSLGINAAQVILVFLAATLSKTLGAWVMAKRAGLPREEVFALSLALNARGAMEILMAKFALSAGVITNEFFISLVVMAIATSLMIKPALRLKTNASF